MLQVVKGIYENGRVILEETPRHIGKAKIIVTFLDEKKPVAKKHHKERIPGALKGKVTIPDDFNEPLDDLKDYS